MTSLTINSELELENRNQVRISETQDRNVILIIVTIVYTSTICFKKDN